MCDLKNIQIIFIVSKVDIARDVVFRTAFFHFKQASFLLKILLGTEESFFFLEIVVNALKIFFFSLCKKCEIFTLQYLQRSRKVTDVRF